MTQRVVIGVDSSTQSTKVIALDPESGEIVGEGRAPHTGTNIQDPRDWWRALVIATREAMSPEFEPLAISVAAQQHGLVTLDAEDQVLLPAPLWNNTAAAADAERLNPLADFARDTGNRLVAAITIAKVAHLARVAPDDLAHVRSICQPHDWLTFQLCGNLVTDRGDASGSGWWSPAAEVDRRDLLALAVGDRTAARLRLPRVLGPMEPAGELTGTAAAELGLPAGIPVGPGTGDNMAAALGVGAEPGEYVVSLGTSGVAYQVSETTVADELGEVCGFASADGRFLPLTCMLNCTRVFDVLANLLRIDRDEALNRARGVEPGAGGLLLLPYLDGERTPNLPHVTGSLFGITAAAATPDQLLRAAVDGVAAGLAYCVAALQRVGIDAPGVTLVGGGAQHQVWRQAIADATGLPVSIRGGGEHVARGAAIQATAIARDMSIRELVHRFRPPVIAGATPREDALPAFRLDERRDLIDSLRPVALHL